MPRYSFKNRRTGQTVEIPWESEMPPTPEDVQRYMWQQERGIIGKSWDALNAPLQEATSRFANWAAEGSRRNSPDSLHQTLNDYVPGLGTGAAMVRGAQEGVTQGVGNILTALSSPLSLGLTAATLGGWGAAKAGYTGAATALNATDMLGSLGLAGHGAYNVIAGDGAGERGAGLVEIAGGLLGARGASVRQAALRAAAMPRAITDPSRLLPAPGDEGMAAYQIFLKEKIENLRASGLSDEVIAAELRDYMTGGARFRAGEAGVADRMNVHQFHDEPLANPWRDVGPMAETMRDIGETVQVSPHVAAQTGLGARVPPHRPIVEPVPGQAFRQQDRRIIDLGDGPEGQFNLREEVVNAPLEPVAHPQARAQVIGGELRDVVNEQLNLPLDPAGNPVRGNIPPINRGVPRPFRQFDQAAVEAEALRGNVDAIAELQIRAQAGVIGRANVRPANIDPQMPPPPPNAGPPIGPAPPPTAPPPNTAGVAAALGVPQQPHLPLGPAAPAAPVNQIERAIQQLVAMGIPEDQARAMLQAAGAPAPAQIGTTTANQHAAALQAPSGPYVPRHPSNMQRIPDNIIQQAAEDVLGHNGLDPNNAPLVIRAIRGEADAHGALEAAVGKPGRQRIFDQVEQQVFDMMQPDGTAALAAAPAPQPALSHVRRALEAHDTPEPPGTTTRNMNEQIQLDAERAAQPTTPSAIRRAMESPTPDARTPLPEISPPPRTSAVQRGFENLGRAADELRAEQAARAPVIEPHIQAALDRTIRDFQIPGELAEVFKRAALGLPEFQGGSAAKARLTQEFGESGVRQLMDDFEANMMRGEPPPVEQVPFKAGSVKTPDIESPIASSGTRAGIVDRANANLDKLDETIAGIQQKQALGTVEPPVSAKVPDVEAPAPRSSTPPPPTPEGPKLGQTPPKPEPRKPNLNHLDADEALDWWQDTNLPTRDRLAAKERLTRLGLEPEKPGITDRVKRFMQDESGYLDVTELAKGIVEFSKKAKGKIGDALGEVKVRASIKSSAVEKTVPSFVEPFKVWVGKRNAAQTRAVIKARDFRDLDDDGLEGILAYQRDGATGRYKKIADYFDEGRERAEAAELMMGWKENYVTQMWDNTPEEIAAAVKKIKGLDSTLKPPDPDAVAPRKEGRLTMKPSFVLKSFIKTYQEGIDAGLKPKFEKVSDVVHWYEHTLNKALADRQFFATLKDTGMIRMGHKAPMGWKDLKSDYFPSFGKRGEARKQWKAHPDVVDAIENYMKEQKGFIHAAAGVVQISKDIALSSGVIPGTALNAHGFNILARNAASRGFLKGTIEGIGYMLNPGAPNPVSRLIEKWTPWESARKSFEGNLPDAPKYVEAGLNLSTEGFEFGIPRHTNWLLKNVHGKFFEDPLFQHLIPALKMKHVKTVHAELLAKGMDETAAIREAARLTNEAYGGINIDFMFRDKSFQDFARTLLIAPDWLESNLRFGVGTVKSVVDKSPTGQIQKQQLMNIAGAYVMANVANYSMSGQLMVQNDPGHKFQINTGVRIKGADKRDKTVYINPFGTAFDLMRLGGETAASTYDGDLSQSGRILRNRLAMPTGATVNWLTNQDWRGRKLLGKDDYGRQIPMSTQLGRGLQNLADPFTPQYVGGAMDWLTGESSPLEAATGGLEAPLRFGREPRPKGGRNRVGRSRSRNR
jgi:hypothetical protein